MYQFLELRPYDNLVSEKWKLITPKIKKKIIFLKLQQYNAITILEIFSSFIFETLKRKLFQTKTQK